MLHRTALKIQVLLALTAVLCLPCYSAQQRKANKQPSRQIATVNVGFGDGKCIVVPLQVGFVNAPHHKVFADIDEFDVEAADPIAAHAGTVNGIDTIILEVPYDRLAMPQTVKVSNLRFGNSVTFTLSLRGTNVYRTASVQSQGNVLRLPKRHPLTSGKVEERLNGYQLEVSYIPPPTGMIWRFTENFTAVPEPSPLRSRRSKAKTVASHP